MNAPISRQAKGMTLRLAEIVIPASARPCDTTTVAELARSIEAIGLQSAPTIVERDGRYVLVAGRHRIEALRLLGVESILVRLVDMDDIEARLWTISENLHRAELTVLQRAEQITEYARLAQEKREAAKAVQLAHPRGGAQPHDTGLSASARELGLTREEVRRAEQIASIAPEAMRVAERAGLDDNQAALLAAARERTPEAQIGSLQDTADRGRVAPEPPAKPLRNLENISGGELARWIKLTTPNDRPHVVRVLEMAAAILRDELARPEASSPQNCALDDVSEETGVSALSSDKSPPAGSLGPDTFAGPPKGRIRI